MFYKKYASLFALALLAGPVAPIPNSTGGIVVFNAIARAGSPETFPLPTSVPSGTRLSIDGSSSMKNINQTIGDSFQKAYPGTVVTTAYGGSSSALKAVEEGKLDLAAIGRELTEAEKARGLREVAVARHKIALITSPDNPFDGSLTIDQFAAIFYGKLKNWSEVGGPAGEIRFVDRPETSDTRSAFENYSVFRKEPLKTGANAVIAPADTIEAVTEELGNNGIGYAIVDRVVNNPKVKIIKMHGVLPSDPRYPFSQSLVYVYKGPAPNEAVKAFLGYATAPDKQAAIEAARLADAGIAPSPQPVASPETTAQVPATAIEEPRQGLPGWLWWLLPLIALPLLYFLFKGGEDEPSAAPVAEPAPPPPVPVPPIVPPPVAREGRIVLVPRNCREAYAYWEVSDAEKASARRQGGEKLALRVYDVTDIDLDKQPAHDMRQHDCRELDPDLPVPIPVDDRDYVAELGYLTPEGNWLKLIRSGAVRVPACPPDEPLPLPRKTLVEAPLSVVGGAGAVAAYGPVARERANTAGIASSRIVLVPRDEKTAYAYWELTDTDKARSEGKLVLRVHDVTGIDLDRQPAHDTRQYNCREFARDLHVPIPWADRDYLAEIGTVTPEGNWSSLARSKHVHVPAPRPDTGFAG